MKPLVFRSNVILVGVLFICALVVCLSGCRCNCNSVVQESPDEMSLSLTDSIVLHDADENNGDPFNLAPAGFPPQPFNRNLFKSGLEYKASARGGYIVRRYNPEVDSYRSIHFVCALSGDWYDAPSWRDQIKGDTVRRDPSLTYSISTYLTEDNQNRYNLPNVLSPGDVIGCRMDKLSQMIDYDALMKMGVKFVESDIYKKTLMVEAGEENWMRMKIDGNRHVMAIRVEPNLTGQERKMGIALHASNGFVDFERDAIHIYQAADAGAGNATAAPAVDGRRVFDKLDQMIAELPDEAFNENMFSSYAVHKISADGGDIYKDSNPEVKKYGDVKFVCAIQQDLCNLPEDNQLVSYGSGREDVRLLMTPSNVNDFDLRKILSPGDVMGCDLNNRKAIKHYDTLVKKGVRFVDGDVYGKTLNFRAGEGQWVRVKGDNGLYTHIQVFPNKTGKERKLALCFHATYNGKPFTREVIQIYQAAE